MEPMQPSMPPGPMWTGPRCSPAVIQLFENVPTKINTAHTARTMPVVFTGSDGGRGCCCCCIGGCCGATMEREHYTRGMPVALVLAMRAFVPIGRALFALIFIISALGHFSSSGIHAAAAH